MTLVKATLEPLRADAQPTSAGPAVEVQFNPASLRLQMTNNVEGGEARRRQAQQHAGSSSTTLTLDLHFDTADEGFEGTFRNVRDKTASVRRFVLPPESNPSQAPPRVRFHWGEFVFIGVVTGVTEDIDLFSPRGIPLRAKCSVTMKEQDPRFEALQRGAGAATGANATPPRADAASGDSGPGSAGPGGAAAPGARGAGAGSTAGAPGTDRTAQAVGGESLADFATRMGLDPSAWRGLAAGVESALALPAGLELDFSSALSTARGIGALAGAAAGAAASAEAAFGLAPAPGAPAGGSAQQGFALAAAGGVGPALQSVQIAKAATAAAQAKDAFATAPAPGAAAPAAGARPAQPPQPRPALQATGLPGPSAQAAAAPAPAPPLADPRAVGFGFGVPLRPTVGRAVRDRAAVVQGWLPPGGAATRLAPDPTLPRWALPVPAPDELVAASPSGRPGTSGGCGCGCGGGCGGHA